LMEGGAATVIVVMPFAVAKNDVHRELMDTPDSPEKQ